MKEDTLFKGLQNWGAQEAREAAIKPAKDAFKAAMKQAEAAYDVALAQALDAYDTAVKPYGIQRPAG